MSRAADKIKQMDESPVIFGTSESKCHRCHLYKPWGQPMSPFWLGAVCDPLKKIVDSSITAE